MNTLNASERKFNGMLKRFYISVWETVEAFQHSRPPAHIVGIIDSNLQRAKDGLRREVNAKLFSVFHCVECSDTIDEAITLEQFRNLR